VPQPVRDALFALAKSHLAENGIVYLSYNAYPGCHVREQIWEGLRPLAAHIEDQDERYAKAITYLQMLSEMSDDLFSPVVKGEAKRMLENTRELLLCDDLSLDNRPYSFRGFLAAAQGLQFLAEADYPDLAVNHLDSWSKEQLAALGVSGRLEVETVTDAMRGRRFRQTLLCHDHLTIFETPDADVLPNLYAECQVKTTAANMEPGVPMTFTKAEGGRVTTDNPPIKRALTTMAESFPAPVAVRDLMRDDPAPVADLLMKGYRSGLIDLIPHAANFVTQVSDKPALNRLARAQLKLGLGHFTCLRNRSVQLPNDAARELLLLLDGTRTVEQVEIELEASVRAMSDDEVGDLRRPGGVAAAIKELARFALFEA